MPDEPQNPISEPVSQPTSPQAPTEPAPISTIDSELAEMPPEVPEAPLGDFEVKSSDIPPSDSTPSGTSGELKTKEKQAENEPAPASTESSSEAKSESEEVPEPETAQIRANDPLSETKKPETKRQESEPESKEESNPEAETQEPEPEKEKPKLSYLKSQKLDELLIMARTAIQFRKRKKLDKIMTLFLKQSKITNDEVEKFLHVSDATATRYLSQLEKEGKIKQNGKTGKGVLYSRI